MHLNTSTQKNMNQFLVSDWCVYSTWVCFDWVFSYKNDFIRRFWLQNNWHLIISVNYTALCLDFCLFRVLERTNLGNKFNNTPLCWRD
jgi:hypothetical protein